MDHRLKKVREMLETDREKTVGSTSSVSTTYYMHFNTNTILVSNRTFLKTYFLKISQDLLRKKNNK